MRSTLRHRLSVAGTLLFVCWLAGACTQSVSVSGLKPIFPPAERGWPNVASVQPTLQWEALQTGRQDGGSNSIEGVITNPLYDLKIWREEHGRAVALVYDRRNLANNAHKLAHPLRPASRYSWTVRARFDLDGRQRVSPWTRIGAWTTTGVIQVPSYFYLGFKTPTAEPAPQTN